MALIVRRPGTYSLLVDAGRPGSLHVGMPRGGPADMAAWVLGNALVGNMEPTSSTALELTLHGPQLESTSTHSLVVWGAAFAVQVRRADSPHSDRIPVGHVFNVHPGDEISIQGIEGEQGLRGYLCVHGGFQTTTFLESQSALEPVVLGQSIAARTLPPLRSRWIAGEPWKDVSPAGILRFTAGTHLTKALRTLLLETKFKVRPESNRMGLRLHSTASWPSEGKELVSAPVTPGTLQLPGGGQPILLGVDAQTIGGYPRLGHVIEADLDSISQIRPGTSLRFQLVTLEEAEQLAESRRAWLRSWQERIRWSS